MPSWADSWQVEDDHIAQPTCWALYLAAMEKIHYMQVCHLRTIWDPFLIYILYYLRSRDNDIMEWEKTIGQ